MEPSPPTAVWSPRSAARRASRTVLAASTAAALPLGAASLAVTLAGLATDDLAPAAAGLCLGLLAADAVTGLAHWAFDTWGSERTRVVGPRLIRAFREHHHDPLGICRHDWLEVNGEPATSATLAYVLLLLAWGAGWLDGRPGIAAFGWGLVTFGALANQIHRWAHEPHPPRVVGALQRSGVLLSPQRHARHHGPPHTGAYCIATGWLNGPLDAVGFWRGLERAVQAASGHAPRRPTDPSRTPEEPA